MNKLEILYNNKSRHSQYQRLATNIVPLLENYDKPLKSKYEMERMDFVKKHFDLNDKKILDIGGNTGFFTFESCAGSTPKSVDYYEGNIEHAEFVEVGTNLLKLDHIIKVHPKYFLFNDVSEKWDIVLFFNVIHHLGFDFDKEVGINDVKEKMLEYINDMAKYSRYMVFQMGFNWYGDVSKPFFANGTKKEMEDYIINGTSEEWEIVSIGIAEKVDDSYVYNERNESNNIRVDGYGEFLNRPIFIMKSRLI